MLDRQFFTSVELADLHLPGVPKTPAGILIRANTENWRNPDTIGVNWRPRQGKGGGVEYHYALLPREAIAKLLLVHGRRQERPKKESRAALAKNDLWAWFEKLPQAKRDEAEARLKAIVAVEDLVAKGSQREMAAVHVATERGVSKSTLYNWMKIVAAVPRADWAPHLAPRHAGRAATVECDPEAWEFYKGYYLRQSKPTVADSYEKLQDAAKQHGWTIPSARTLQRRIEALPKATQVYLRDGEKALARMQPAQERDRTTFHALEAVNTDGHEWDVFVKWPDDTIGRPVMVAFQDLYSNKVLSWRIDRSENKDLVRLAFGDMVEEFGIPQHCLFDNGRAFASKWMTGGIKNRFRFKVRDEDPEGIMKLLGVEVHWATPAHGQAKPIERMFGDVEKTIGRHPLFEGATTGHNPMAKPENYRSRAVPLDVFVQVVAEGFAAHNARQGRKTLAAHGRSFDETFDASYAEAPIQKATAEQRRLWLLAAEAVKTDGEDGSLRLHENRYWAEFLHEHIGQKLTLRFDPQDLHKPVHVYRLNGAYLGMAPCIERTGFFDTEAARTSARASRSITKARRDIAKAEQILSPMEVAAKMAPAAEKTPPAEAKVIRLFTNGANALKARPQDFPHSDLDDDRVLDAMTRLHPVGSGLARLAVNQDGDD